VADNHAKNKEENKFEIDVLNKALKSAV